MKKDLSISDFRIARQRIHGSAKDFTLSTFRMEKTATLCYHPWNFESVSAAIDDLKPAGTDRLYNQAFPLP